MKTNIFTNENKKKLKILAILFKDCNNDCKFCFEKKFTGIPTKQEFINNPDLVIAKINECLTEREKYDEVTLNLMGGELFYDKHVEPALDKIIDFAIQNKLNVRLTTNLLYKNLGFLLGIYRNLKLGNVGCEIFSSFDFKNRFKDLDQLELFCDNVERLSLVGVPVTIETIRTKEMLKAFKEQTIEYKIFRVLAKNFKISVNELIGTDLDLALSYEESVELWKMIINHCRTSDLKTHFLDHGRNCANIQRMMIIGDKIYKGCVPQKFDLKEEGNHKLEYLQKFTLQYSCLNCKYMNVCSLKCPMEPRYSECDIKAIHEWLEMYNIIL